MTKYNRIKKSKTYHKKQLPVSLPKDKRLGLVEIGIMYYILSQSDNWVIVKSKIVYEFNQRGNSINSIEVAWKKLLNLGYLIVKRNGLGQGSSWIINEVSND